MTRRVCRFCKKSIALRPAVAKYCNGQCYQDHRAQKRQRKLLLAQPGDVSESLTEALNSLPIDVAMAETQG